MKWILLNVFFVLCLILTANGIFADTIERPSNITIDDNGYIYVVCGKGTWRYELRKYGKNGKLAGVLNTIMLSLWASDFKKDFKTERGQVRNKFIRLADYLKCAPNIEAMLQKMIFSRMVAIRGVNQLYVLGDDIFAKSYLLGFLDPNDGHPIKVFDVGGEGKRYLKQPQGLAVDREGNFYVTDYWDDKVKIFNSNGEFVRAFGGSGSKDGQFKAIKAIAVDDKNGYIYVTDNYYPTMLRGSMYDPNQMRVQKFTKDGKFVLKWGSRKYKTFSVWPPNLLYEDELDEPYGIMLDSKGNVYVLTNHTPEVRKYTSEGKLIMKWGKYGRGTGEFSDPQAIVVDKEDNVYVADTGNNRVQKFDSNGKFLKEIK